MSHASARALSIAVLVLVASAASAASAEAAGFIGFGAGATGDLALAVNYLSGATYYTAPARPATFALATPSAPAHTPGDARTLATPPKNRIVYEYLPATSTPALTVSGDVTQAEIADLAQKLQTLSESLDSLRSQMSSTNDAAQPSNSALMNAIATTNYAVADSNGATLNNVTVNGVSGLTASDIPNLSASYLSTGGGTISGNLTVSGAFSGAALTLANASTTLLSVLGPAYFGSTATSTFGADGSLTLAKALGVGSGGTGTTTWQTGSIPFFNGTNLTEDNSNLYWDAIDHRLGIGTTSPAAKLAVSGNSATTPDLVMNSANGFDALDIVNTGSSNKTWSIYPSGNDLHIWEYGAGQTFGGAGATRLTIQAGGNVGIGTTTPSQTLSVQGNSYFAGNVGVDDTSSSYALDVAGNVKLGTSDSVTNSIDIFGNLNFVNGAAPYPAMYIEQAGQTSRSIEIPGNGGDGNFIINNDNGYGISINNSSYDGNYLNISPSTMRLNVTNPSSSGAYGGGVFFTFTDSSYNDPLYTFGDANNERSDQNGPSIQLVAGQGGNSNGPNGGNVYIDAGLEGSGATAVNRGKVLISTNVDANVGISSSTPWGKLAVSLNNGETNTNAFIIASSTASATTTLFDILNSGSVGIGTTTPYSRLEVWGPDTASTTAFLVANSASTTAFSVLDNGNATLAGSLTQNSDERLKTDIQSLDASSSLAAIEALNPVSFNWIDNMFGSTDQLGFIAQAVQQIFPQLVSTTSPTALTPGGTLGLNYTGLIAPIVGAIKEIGSISGDFKTALSAWLGDASNGVGDFFATNGHFSNGLCVGSTCIDQAQLAALLAGQGSANGVANSATTDTPSCTLAAAPSQVAPGDHAVLSWTAINAGTFSLDQGIGAVSPADAGTTTTKAITADTTFTGTAVSPTGRVTTCSASVSVTSTDATSTPPTGQGSGNGAATSTPPTDTATSTPPAPPSDSGAASTSPSTASSTTS